MVRGQVSKFQRCSICNFGALTPSQYISERSSDRSNKVVYNQTLKEHICTDCQSGIGFKKKKDDWTKGKFQSIADFGALELIDEDFDELEIEEFLEKQPESN